MYYFGRKANLLERIYLYRLYIYTASLCNSVLHIEQFARDFIQFVFKYNKKYEVNNHDRNDEKWMQPNQITNQTKYIHSVIDELVQLKP